MADLPHTAIEDYAVIGDMETCALVNRDGSVDWLCLPRFDSPSSFTAVLGSPDNGRWLIGPQDVARASRRYVGSSFVLETTHETDSGVVRVTDAMPTGDGRADIVRVVEGVSGTVRMEHEWVVRFGYGKVTPWVSRDVGPGGPDDRLITAVAGPDMLVLRGDRLPKAADGRHCDVFDVSGGRLSRSRRHGSPRTCPCPRPPTSHRPSRPPRSSGRSGPTAAHTTALTATR